MQGFAQELVDSVLDFLPDDKHTLSACSLVCHSWVGRARLHLFATVGVGQDEKHSLTAFADFLDAIPYFRPVIRNLKVEFPQKYRMEESRDCGIRVLPGSQLMIGPHDISRVMEKLPGIRTLSFKHALLGTHGPNCSHPSQQFQLDRLAIEDSHSPSPGDSIEPVGQNLLDILGLFSQIRELHFHRPAEFVGPLVPHEVVHEGYRVSKFLLSVNSLSLSFTRQGSVPMVSVISSALNLSNTTSLTVSCTNEEDMVSVAHIVRCAGARLREFDFNLTQLDFDALLRQLQNPLTLSACTNLENFVFRLDIEDYDQNYQQIAWEVTLRILSSVMSILKTFEFWTPICGTGGISESQQDYWNQFKAFVISFPSLESLSFPLCSQQGNTAVVRDFVHNTFPELHLKGLLHI